MEERRRVLVLAVQADDRRLAVALDGSPQRLHRPLPEQRAERLPRLDQGREVVRKPSRERVLDDGHRRRLADRLRDLPPAVCPDFFDDRDELADLHGPPPLSAPRRGRGPA